LGCATCHTGEGDSRGPGLGDLFGRPVQLEDGRRVIVDEDYLRRAILDPGSEIVAGYRPLMPTYKGLVSEEGLLQLIAYIRSLSPDGAVPASSGGTEAQGATQGGG